MVFNNKIVFDNTLNQRIEFDYKINKKSTTKIKIIKFILPL